MAITIQTQDGSLYLDRSSNRHVVLFHQSVLFDGEVPLEQTIPFESGSRKYVLRIYAAANQPGHFSYSVTQQDGTKSRTTQFGHDGRRVGERTPSHGVAIVVLAAVIDRAVSTAAGFLSGYGYAAWLDRVRGLPLEEIRSIFLNGNLFSPFGVLVLFVQVSISCLTGLICYRVVQRKSLLYPACVGFVTGTLTFVGSLGMVEGNVLIFDFPTAIVLGCATFLATFVGGLISRQQAVNTIRRTSLDTRKYGLMVCRNPECNVQFQANRGACPICGAR